MKHKVSRRTFLGKTAKAAAAFSVIPNYAMESVIDDKVFNEKLNMAAVDIGRLENTVISGVISKDELKKESIPNDGDRFEVIVAGAGPAGISAALAASSMGVKTLLLEARAFMGGVAATSLWMPMNRIKLNGGSRGFTHEMLVDKIQSFGNDAFVEGKVTWVDGDGLHIHPDYLRLGVFELLEQYGCKYRLNSPVIGAKVIDGVIKEVTVGTKNGSAAFSADVFVDCTGDGDLSYYAGMQTFVGKEDTGTLMPVTLGFMLANVDTDRLFQFYNTDESKRFPDIIRQADEMGYSVSTFYSFDRTSIPGVISVNNGGLRDVGPLNAVDPRDSTAAERICLQLVMDFIAFARKLIPGLENCCLVRTGATVGVRETRRVMGDYVVSIEDAQGVEFEDVVSRRYGAVDQAGLPREDRLSMVSGYAFPYRALLVKGIEGLMVAGRCGSYTHEGLAAGKSMGNMMGMGQAAGAAAALCVQQGVTPRKLPYNLVQKALTDRGVQL